MRRKANANRNVQREIVGMHEDYEDYKEVVNVG
jgi:hypothetical protein